LKDDKKNEYKRVTYYLPVVIINKVKALEEPLKMKNSAVVHQALEDFLKKHGG
jgi:hypothetical protein